MDACSELTWITAAPHSHRVTQPTTHNPYLCHKHLYVPKHVPFWKGKWKSIREYLLRTPHTRLVLVTDLYDVHMNPMTTKRVTERFQNTTANTSLLISTEDVCWIGRNCHRKDVERFESAHLSNRKFMHSQFMGERSAVMHMLTWGLRLGIHDDMHMMYEYVIAHPRRVTLDESYSVFGSIAFADLDARSPFMCREGTCSASRTRRKCVRHQQGVCVQDGNRTLCPILWHANGLLSRDFLRLNPSCLRMLGRLK